MWLARRKRCSALVESGGRPSVRGGSGANISAAAICESKSSEVERDRPDGRRSAFVVGGGNWWWSEALLGGGRLW
jgi:hypothetical protein